MAPIEWNKLILNGTNLDYVIIREFTLPKWSCAFLQH